MSTFIKFISKRKLNASSMFCLTAFEYKFGLIGAINMSEWPLMYSKYILGEIKLGLPSNTFVLIRVSHPKAEGYIPSTRSEQLTPTIFQEHFEKIFSGVDALDGVLTFEVTHVTVPGCCLK